MVAVIWLIPLACVFGALSLAALLIFHYSFLSGTAGGLLFAALAMLFAVTSFAALLVATTGTMLFTASGSHEPATSGWVSARVGVRLWLSAGVLLGAALMMTSWLPPEQEALLDVAIYSALIPVFAMFAACMSVHTEHLAARYGGTTPARPGSIRLFTPRFAAGVVVSCLLVSGALQVLGTDRASATERAIADSLMGAAMLITVVMLLGASRDVDALYRRLQSRGSRRTHAARAIGDSGSIVTPAAS